MQPLSAQIITEQNPNGISLTTPEQARYTALSGNSAYDNVGFVTVTDLQNLSSLDTLIFKIPFESDTLRIEASLVRDDPNGFLWSGRILNHPGYAGFWQQGGLTGGFLQVEQRYYEIRALNSTYQFWVKYENPVYQRCGNQGVQTESDSIYNNDPGPEYCPKDSTHDTCPALISILLVITDSAKTYIESEYGNIATYALLGQAVVNQAFYNSDIPNKEVRIMWIVKRWDPLESTCRHASLSIL